MSRFGREVAEQAQADDCHRVAGAHLFGGEVHDQTLQPADLQALDDVHDSQAVCSVTSYTVTRRLPEGVRGISSTK